MQVKPKTPRTEMVFSSIASKMIDFLKPLAEQLDYTLLAVDEQLTNFARISARVAPSEDEFDFEMAAPSDTPEQIKAKFLQYIDTGCYNNVETALGHIRKLDLPLTPREQQPEKLPKDADPNS